MDERIKCGSHGAWKSKTTCGGAGVEGCFYIGAYWLAIKPKVDADVAAKSRNETRSSRLSGSRK